MEKTLVIFKPDAVQRGIIGEILSRFEKAGLKIIGMKMLRPDKDHFHYHYDTIGKVKSRHGQQVFDDTLSMMQAGPVIAAVLEGIEAVATVRKLVGATEPKSALPGTIRGDYAHMSYGHADRQKIAVINIIHASGSPDEAALEVGHWFNDDELFDYPTVHERFTQQTKRHVNKPNAKG